jgi:hypothetical protein
MIGGLEEPADVTTVNQRVHLSSFHPEEDWKNGRLISKPSVNIRVPV